MHVTRKGHCDTISFIALLISFGDNFVVFWLTELIKTSSKANPLETALHMKKIQLITLHQLTTPLKPNLLLRFRSLPHHFRHLLIQTYFVKSYLIFHPKSTAITSGHNISGTGGQGLKSFGEVYL